MNFEFLLHAATPIPSHAIAAFMAIILGAIQFALPKGTKHHRLIGYAWVASFSYVVLSSFFIHEIRVLGPFSPIHILSVISLFAIVFAIRAARRGNINAHRRTMIRLYIFALIITAGFTLLPGRVMHQVLFGV